jgi:branched-chain amino acid transport system ATP-binding protein
MSDNSSSFITPNSSLLEVSSLHAGYGPTEVLKGVSLTVQAGEIVAVLGANGAGKSTTLMTICSVNHCRRGCIMFDGAQIQNTPPHEIVRRGISQVPEGRHIFPRLTVRENLELGAFQRDDRDDIHTDLERVFSSFPILKERQNQLGGTLSGGEQQMLAISRALMARPRLLLLDEPSLGLAPMIVTKIFDIIRGINQQGTTILLVEQNANMALHVAHRGYVLETGRIVLQGTAKSLMNNEQVKKSYLGG